MNRSGRLRRLEKRRGGRVLRDFEIWLPDDAAGLLFWANVGGVRVVKTAQELAAEGAIEIGGPLPGASEIGGSEAAP